jgi:hypothetical protein
MDGAATAKPDSRRNSRRMIGIVPSLQVAMKRPGLRLPRIKPRGWAEIPRQRH